MEPAVEKNILRVPFELNSILIGWIQPDLRMNGELVLEYQE